jgi:UDP-glucose 6-dehydrogenase
LGPSCGAVDGEAILGDAGNRSIARQTAANLLQDCSPPIASTGSEENINSLLKARALATKITFINEIADLCEKVGADVQDLVMTTVNPFRAPAISRATS